MKEWSLLRPTGYEFAKAEDLDRDEAWARFTGTRSLLLRIKLERQHRSWSDEQRAKFSGLSERWYLIK